MFTLLHKRNLKYIETDSVRSLPGIVHAFGTRWSNAGSVVEEIPQSVARLASIFDISPGAVRLGTQVHGDRIVVLDDLAPERANGEDRPVCDGFITARPGMALAVRTADCVPLLLFDPRLRVVGMVHAGWKGTALGIASKAVEIFKSRFSSDPATLVAVIGPSIGPCCYEVGREVYRAIESVCPAEQVFSPEGPDGRRMLDLGGASRLQLVHSGLPSDNITAVPLCTVCRDDLFFSWRGQGQQSGRQVSAVMLR